LEEDGRTIVEEKKYQESEEEKKMVNRENEGK
jgi:hypothetical protein